MSDNKGPATTSTRRSFLAGAAALGTGVLNGQPACSEVASDFGVAAFSYAYRLSSGPDSERLRDPLSFLAFCRQRGAGGVQTRVPVRDAAYYAEIRRELERSGSWLEASVPLPRDEADLARFEAEIQAGQSSGVTVFRSVLQGGRRYEAFDSLEAFRAFEASARSALEAAARVMSQRKARLAVENHKDYRAEELVSVLRRLGNEFVGVTVDLGNNVALLEDPVETVELLAPFAMSVHLKDMAVEPADTGFLLSEVPLGTGYLDLPHLISVLRKARPELRFCLEMATRDPLLVPCLTDQYWATLNQLPPVALAGMLTIVRKRKEGRPLRRYAGMDAAARLAEEDANVHACLQFAKARLTP